MRAIRRGDTREEPGADLVDVAPFTALRYDPAIAGSPAATSAPAYDLMDPMAYAQHRTANPYTVLELMGPDDAYERSRQLFDRWRRTGVLVAEGPALFRYEEHELVDALDSPLLDVQRGLLVALRLEPLDGGSVLPHEEVDPGRVEARLRMLEAVPAELDPVYLLLEDPPQELTALLTDDPPAPPIVAATDEAGTDHRIWAVEDPATQAEVARLLAGTRAVIADGHHRYARSLALRDRCRAGRAPFEVGQVGAEPPWERVFAYLVDPRAGGPRVEAIHRLLSPIAPTQLEALLDDFDAYDAPSDPRALLAELGRKPGHAYGLVRSDGRAQLLRARDDVALRARLDRGRAQAWGRLDAAVLAEAVLPRLGLPSSAVRARVDAEAAVAEVTRSRDAAVLLLRPPDISTVMRLASAGERLPYKSTRFVPKPRTGLLLRPLDSGAPGPVP